jgi:hypothetical protein
MFSSFLNEELSFDVITHDNIIIYVRTFLFGIPIYTKKIVSSDPIEKRMDYYNDLERWLDVLHKISEEYNNTNEKEVYEARNMIQWISLFLRYEDKNRKEAISEYILEKKRFLIIKCCNAISWC